VVERLAPGELRRSFTFAQACAGTEMQSERDLPDMHENGTRQLTLSFECPPRLRSSVGGDGQNLDCVVLNAAALRAHICYRISDVQDTYVGVCKGDSLECSVVSRVVQKRQNLYSYSAVS
jgi:hypothetical protein